VKALLREKDKVTGEIARMGATFYAVIDISVKLAEWVRFLSFLPRTSEVELLLATAKAAQSAFDALITKPVSDAYLSKLNRKLSIDAELQGLLHTCPEVGPLIPLESRPQIDLGDLPEDWQPTPKGRRVPLDR
jgi:hypothetical protein